MKCTLKNRIFDVYFANIWPKIKQRRLIFSNLNMWFAVAGHNLSCASLTRFTTSTIIMILQNGGNRFWILADCHVLSVSLSTCLKASIQFEVDPECMLAVLQNEVDKNYLAM